VAQRVSNYRHLTLLQAEYFHRFGSALMKLTSDRIEEAYKEKMLETMAAQEQGAAN
jgi:hypothetical protein